MHRLAASTDRILSFVRQLRPGQGQRRGNFNDLIAEYVRNGTIDLSALICECMEHGEVDALAEILATEDVRRLRVQRGAGQDGMGESGWNVLLQALEKRGHRLTELTLSGGCYDFSTGGALLSMLARMPWLAAVSFEHVAATSGAGLLRCDALGSLKTLKLVAGAEEGAELLPLAILRGGCRLQNLCIEEQGAMGLGPHARLAEAACEQEKLVSLRLRIAAPHAREVFACYEPVLQGSAPLETVDLGHCAIGPGHCDMVLKSLRNKKTLSRLLLNDCAIGPAEGEGFPKIQFQVLASMSGLRELDLGRNGLGDDALMLVLCALNSAIADLLHLRLNDNGAGRKTMAAAASVVAKNRGLLSLCLWRDDVLCPDEDLQQLADAVERHDSLLLLRVNADASAGPNARALARHTGRNRERLAQNGMRLVFEEAGRQLPGYLFDDILFMTAAHLAVRDAVNLSSINKAARGRPIDAKQDRDWKVLLSSRLDALPLAFQDKLRDCIAGGTAWDLDRVIGICMDSGDAGLLHDILANGDESLEELCIEAEGVRQWDILVKAASFGPLRINELRLAQLRFDHATIAVFYKVLARIPALRTLTLEQVELEGSLFFESPKCPWLPFLKNLTILAGETGAGVAPLVLAIMQENREIETLTLEEEGALLEDQHAAVGVALCAQTKLGEVRLLIENVQAFHHYLAFVRIAPLVVLDISECRIGAFGGNQLLEALQHKITLTHLSLKKCELHIDHATERLQVQYFRGLTGLRELDLSRNQLGSDTLAPLLYLLRDAGIPLLTLELSQNFYGTETFAAMASWLERNPMLRSVGFINAAADADVSLVPLAAALKRNTSLLWFDIGGYFRQYPGPASVGIGDRLRQNRNRLKASLMEGGVRVLLHDAYDDIVRYFAELAAPMLTMRDAANLASINMAAQGAGRPEPG